MVLRPLPWPASLLPRPFLFFPECRRLLPMAAAASSLFPCLVQSPPAPWWRGCPTHRPLRQRLCLCNHRHRIGLLPILRTSPIVGDKPLPKPGTGPCSAGPAPPPTPLFAIAITGSVAATASRLDLSSLWPDRHLPGLIRRYRGLPRSDLSLPLLFCRRRGHPDQRRRMQCCRPPWRGSSTTGRLKKQEDRPAGALLLCRPADR
jgi:hypothetical protein